MYLYIYLQYIYIEKKNERWACILFKRTQRSAFFCKRTLCSLRSFMFFVKECCVLCNLLRSLQKKVAFFAFFYVLNEKKAKESIVLLGLISRQKLEKNNF